MAQGPRGFQEPQKCFLITPDSGISVHSQVVQRQTKSAPTNTRLQIMRGQGAQTLSRPVPVRVAIIKPVTAVQPRLKHDAVPAVPTERIRQRKIVEVFDQIWPAWQLPIGIRNSQNARASMLYSALLAGKVVGGPTKASGLLLDTSAWQTQLPDMLACFKTCQKMIGTTAPPMGIFMVREKDGKLISLPTMQEGLNLINEYMKNKKPIIVGVNHTIKSGNKNHDKTTDHFVVIVESGSDNKGIYFRFFDPGTEARANGTHPMNRLYLNRLSGFYEGYRVNDKKRKYTLCWVRPSKK